MEDERPAARTVPVVSLSLETGSAVLGVAPDTPSGHRVAWGAAKLHAERAFGLPAMAGRSATAASGGSRCTATAPG